MSITTLALLAGGTTATTGGSAVPFIVKKNENSAVRLVLDDGKPYAEESRVRVHTTEPSKNASSPGGYTQRRVGLTLAMPMTLASGEITYETARVEFSVSTESTNVASLRENAAQLIMTGALDDLFDHGALS